jgi:hypothetical protein
VAATILSAREIFGRVLPILRKHSAWFKVPARLEFLAALNSGLGEFSQVGKFLTVYPRSDAEAVDVARELHATTRGLPAPKVPFDVPYCKNSLVSYRYGAFRAGGKSGAGAKIVDGAGRLRRDIRDRPHAAPNWREDPFQPWRRAAPKSYVMRLIELGLLPYKAHSQRGKGGVYEAVDISVSPARIVIIKEGRRHGEADWLGEDGAARIRREARILRRLRQERLPVPEPLREFTHGNTRYVVLAKISGRPLFGNGRGQPCNFSWRRSQQFLDKLGRLLERIHRAGYVWRDCKPEHILVERDKIRLLDFEGACQIGKAGLLPWGSPDYLPPVYRKKFAMRCAGTLEDDYALGVIAFQSGTGKFPPGNIRRRKKLYQQSKCSPILQARIESLLNAAQN